VVQLLQQTNLSECWTWHTLSIMATQCITQSLRVTTRRVIRFPPPSATVVSAEPFSHGTGTLRCLQKEMATYRHWSVSLWRDPDNVPHCRILSPDKTEWRLISATLCRWIHCFVADQLWLMTRIREEEVKCFCTDKSTSRLTPLDINFIQQIYRASIGERS